MKKLQKSLDKQLCGVCGGIANYLDVDPTLVRVLWAVLTLFSSAFPGVMIYLALAICMPKAPELMKAPELIEEKI